MVMDPLVNRNKSTITVCGNHGLRAGLASAGEPDSIPDLKETYSPALHGF